MRGDESGLMSRQIDCWRHPPHPQKPPCPPCESSSDLIAQLLTFIFRSDRASPSGRDRSPFVRRPPKGHCFGR
jgi:hypothetical protein